MKYHFTFPLLLMFSIVYVEGILVHGNSVNSTDAIHGLSGSNVDLAKMMQMLLNQSAEIENLKQQAETLKQQTSEIQALKQQTSEIQTLKQQAAIDRSINQLLQNRVLLLEAELNKLNNVAANEAYDRNLTHNLNVALHSLNDLKLKDVSTTQQIRNQSMEIENLKHQSATDGSTIQQLLNQSNEFMKFKQDTEKDRLSIQLLLNKSETFKQQSAKEKTSIQLLQNETRLLGRNVDDLVKQVRYTIQSVLGLQAMTEQMNGSLIQLVKERIQIANVSRRIGFTAAVSADNPYWKSGTLVFPVVVTNVGNGYDPSSGVFTAPVPGVYVFFVNVQSYLTQYLRVDIVLNGANQVLAMAYTAEFAAGSNLAVLNLQKDDRVWVRFESGQGYYEYGHSNTFSGFLL